MSSRMRWTARVGVAALAIGIAAPAAWAASTWSPGPNADKATGVATAQYSWNYGSSFGRLTNGNVALAYTSDAGTADSVQSTYVRVGTVDGSNNVTWKKPKLTSQAAKIADRTSLATGGNNIYSTFATQTKYVIDPTKPRVAYARSFVAGSGWGAPVRLSAGTGRIDYPIAAASGDNVYVTYTNSNTGAVLVRRSTNAGSTFPDTVNLGSTTRDDGEGLAAWPINCANGAVAAVVWLDGTGDVKLSVSENSGASYTTHTINAVNAGDDDEGWASCDARGSRIGITFNENDGVYYTEYNTGTDSFSTALDNVFPFAGSDYEASYSGTVALFGTGTVGIAAPLCEQDGCDYTANTTRIDLKWLESTNNGSTFAAAEEVSNATAALSGGKTLNDSPTALFYDADTRMVLYNGWTANYGNYRLYLAVGES